MGCITPCIYNKIIDVILDLFISFIFKSMIIYGNNIIILLI